jgi:phosphatidyl-myo-inositol alpha-mannosyltransferase
MRIAQVSPYDISATGGVQEHIRHLSTHLRLLGHVVWVIAPASADLDDPDRHILRVSETIVEIPFSGSIAPITLSPQVYRRVKSILKRYQFDIVHLHEPLTPLLPLAVLRHSKAVNVGTFHAYRESHAVYEYSKRFLSPFMNRLDGKIAVSLAAHDAISQYFPDHYEIIPNGINFMDFSGPHVDPITTYQDGRSNILFVGRLEKRKGFKYLLEAFVKIKAIRPEVSLLVVGGYDRDDRTPHVQFCRENRLHGVRFIGYVVSELVPSYYRTADVFCAPSTGFESFGIVLLEAMAAGVPIVASDIPGYRSVMTHGREGLLVPPGNSDALAEAILQLLGNPSLRRQMAECGRETARNYDWGRVARHVEAYYEQLIALRLASDDADARTERSVRELAVRVSNWFDPR